MAGQTFSWIADKFLIRRQQNNIDLGRLRAFRRFDRNNYENVINNVTGRVGSASQRLAIAQGLGLQTQGLIIGGQRDGGQASVTSAGRKTTGSSSSTIQGKVGALEEEKRASKGGTIKKKRGTGLPSAPITPE